VVNGANRRNRGSKQKTADYREVFSWAGQKIMVDGNSWTIKKILGYTQRINQRFHTRRSRKFTIMSYEHEPISPMFRIDVSAESESNQPSNDRAAIDLLRQLVAGQQQQNRLLEELVQHQVAANKQRANELQQWKNANPELARSCRKAAETLSRVQTQFLDQLTDEIADSEDHLIEGEYMLNEFVDRFGPRLAHLNGVLQVLAQLGSADANA
jgi:hypothetical protein